MIIIGFVCFVSGIAFHYLVLNAVPDLLKYSISRQERKLVKNSGLLMEACREVTLKMQDEMEDMLKTIKKYEEVFLKLGAKSPELQATINKELGEMAMGQEFKMLTSLKKAEEHFGKDWGIPK